MKHRHHRSNSPRGKPVNSPINLRHQPTKSTPKRLNSLLSASLTTDVLNTSDHRQSSQRLRSKSRDVRIQPLVSTTHNSHRRISSQQLSHLFTDRIFSNRALDISSRLVSHPLTLARRHLAHRSTSSSSSSLTSSEYDQYKMGKSDDLFTFPSPSPEELSLPLGDSVRILTRNEIIEHLAQRTARVGGQSHQRRSGSTTSSRSPMNPTRAHNTPLHPSKTHGGHGGRRQQVVKENRHMDSHGHDEEQQLDLSKSPFNQRGGVTPRPYLPDEPPQPLPSARAPRVNSARKKTAQSSDSNNSPHDEHLKDMSAPVMVKKTRSHTPINEGGGRHRGKSNVYYDDGLFSRNSPSRDPHQTSTSQSSSFSSPLRRFSSPVVLTPHDIHHDFGPTNRAVEDVDGHKDVIGTASDLEQMKRRASYFRVHPSMKQSMAYRRHHIDPPPVLAPPTTDSPQHSLHPPSSSPTDAHYPHQPLDKHI